jgi:serine phosphatase RsbU (regulator of sigma subunit)
MKDRLKLFGTFLLVYSILMILFILFLFPSTEYYQAALQKFNSYATENAESIHENMGWFLRSGFIFGYILFKYTLPFIIYILLNAFLSFTVIKLFSKLKQKVKIHNNFSSPLNMVGSIFANIILFSFGIFSKRSALQLNYYFELPIKTKVTALLSYTLVFIVLGMMYRFEVSNELFDRLYWINFVQPLIPLSLICLTFFIKSFRENYVTKLFWISLSAVITLWIISGITGFQIGTETLNMEGELPSIPFYSTESLLMIFFIIIAFTFYSEVMKYAFTQKVNIENEMLYAQQIQKEMIPEIRISNEFCEIYGKTTSASYIGGDYIDSFNLDDTQLVTAVADVSGHNIASGLLMSMLKTAFRTELKYSSDIKKVTQSINKTIFESKDKSMFISLLYGIFDQERKMVEIINAGHPPLLHLKKNEGRIYEYRTGDTAIGLIEENKFQSKTIDYDSGDIFIFFSDGLIEAKSQKNGKLLGVDGIKQILLNIKQLNSSYELYNSILYDLAKFAGSEIITDDLTILVITIK